MKTESTSEIGGATTFDVTETLHAPAPLGKTIKVHHLLVSSICGLIFTPGTAYVVYADEVNGVLQAGACSRTHQLAERDEDVTFARSSPSRERALVQGKLLRAAVELAKDWRTDKMMRNLEALLLVADAQSTLVIGGNGDVIEPDDGLAAIGSGGPYALSAARALLKHTDLAARQIAEEAMQIAGQICIYSNLNLVIEEI